MATDVEELTIEQQREWNVQLQKLAGSISAKYKRIKDSNERKCEQCEHPHESHWDDFKGEYYVGGCRCWGVYDDEACGCGYFQENPVTPPAVAAVHEPPFWQGTVNLGVDGEEPHFAECRVVAVPGGTRCEVRVGSTDTWVAAQAEQAKCIWLNTRVPTPVARVVSGLLDELNELERFLEDSDCCYSASTDIHKLIETLRKPVVFGVDVEPILSDILHREIDATATLLRTRKPSEITHARVLLEGGYQALKALSDKFEKATQSKKEGT